MAVSLTPGLLAGDIFCCLGLGLLVAALYDAVRFLLGGSRIVLFLLDAAAFLLAAVFLCSFCACRSASGAPRWYLIGAVGAGAAAWLRVVSPATRRARQLLVWGLLLPFRLCRVLVLLPLWRVLCRAAGRFWAKIKKIFVTKPVKQLKKKAKVLYNSN